MFLKEKLFLLSMCWPCCVCQHSGKQRTAHDWNNKGVALADQVSHIPLILPDINVAKLGSVAGLYLDLLGHFSAGEDSVTLEGAEYCVEAALLRP
jgi:hypothetical protein